MRDLKTKLKSEITRCEELVVLYDAIPQGVFGSIMIKADIGKAKLALEIDDAEAIMQAYVSLTRCQ